MKKMSLLVLAFFIGLTTATVTPAMADHGKQCAMCEKCSHGGGYGKDDDSCKCPIASKVMKKAKFFLKNQKEIGLSDEQVAQIKAIKMETKKAGVRAEADMKLFEMDLESKLSEPAVDVEGLNAMLDQAAAGWGTGAKASVATYAKLKAVLNEQQMAKAKEIWTKDTK